MQNIINVGLSDQTVINIAMEHNILPPFRPQISEIGWLTENKSAYVNKPLQPFLQKIPSYFQNTTQFLNYISIIIYAPHNALIISKDVRTSYSSIPHNDCIKACKIHMMKNGFTFMEISNITKMIDFISTHNYFEFSDESFIQSHGTEMGQKMAPTYTNIFMWNFEEYLLDNCTDKPFLYLRYIDDIFVIWRHDEDKLEQFHAYVNSIHPNINLTLTSSAFYIPKIDVSVSFDGTNIHTSIFAKSTDRYGYLHYKCFHPIHIKKSIVYSQFIRYERICSDKLTFEYHASDIFQHFLSKDYPLKLIYRQFIKVYLIDRNNLLNNSHETDTSLHSQYS